MASLVDSFTTHSNAWAAVSRWNNSSTNRCASELVSAPSTFTLDSVKVWLRRVGDIGASHIWLEAWDASSGAPNAIISGGKSNELATSTLTEDSGGGLITFTWTGGPSLSSAGKYFFVLTGDWTPVSSGGVAWFGNGAGESDFDLWQESSSVWSETANGALYTEIYKVDSTPVTINAALGTAAVSGYDATVQANVDVVIPVTASGASTVTDALNYTADGRHFHDAYGASWSIGFETGDKVTMTTDGGDNCAYNTAQGDACRFYWDAAGTFNPSTADKVKAYAQLKTTSVQGIWLQLVDATAQDAYTLSFATIAGGHGVVYKIQKYIATVAQWSSGHTWGTPASATKYWVALEVDKASGYVRGKAWTGAKADEPGAWGVEKADASIINDTLKVAFVFTDDGVASRYHRAYDFALETPSTAVNATTVASNVAAVNVGTGIPATTGTAAVSALAATVRAGVDTIISASGPGGEAVLLDSFTGNTNAWTAVSRWNTNTYRCAVAFVAPETFNLGDITAWLRRNGDVAPGDVWLEVWDDNGGSPNAIIADGTSTALDAYDNLSETPGSEVTFTWPTPPTLAASETYYIVLCGTTNLASSAGLIWHGNGPDSDFVCWQEGAGGWAAVSGDSLYTKVYTAATGGARVAISGYGATVNPAAGISCTKGSVTVAGYGATVNQTVEISCTKGAVTAAGHNTTLNNEAGIIATLAPVSVAGYNPTVTAEVSGPVLLDSFTGNTNSWTAVSRWGGNAYRCAVAFVAPETFALNSIVAWLRRNGDVGAGDVWLEVWDDDGGSPNAIIADGTSSVLGAYVDLSETPGAEETFTWSPSPWLTASETYYFVLCGTTTLAANTGLVWHGNGPDADFVCWQEGAGGWAAVSADSLYTKVYKWGTNDVVINATCGAVTVADLSVTVNVPGPIPVTKAAITITGLQTGVVGVVYYVRADGTAVNKAAATGPTTDASKCMSAGTHNGQTFDPSDTIIISSRGGNFNDYLAPPSSGTAGSPITYRGEAGYNPIFDGQDTRSYCIWTSSSYNNFEDITARNATYACWRAINPGSYLTFRRCTAHGSGEHGFVLGDQSQTIPYAGCIIEDCVAYDNRTNGINWSYLGTDCIIRRNKCYENGLVTGARWTGGIKCYSDTSTLYGFQIYDNECYDNGPAPDSDNQGDGVGIWMDHVLATAGHEVLIYRNYCHGNGGNGIFLEISNYCNVYGNLCVDNGNNTDGGDEFTPANIAVDARYEGSLLGSAHNRVYNNTCIGGRCGIKCASYSQSGGSTYLVDNIFRNNICVDAADHNLIAMLGGNNVTYGSGNVYNSNCFDTEHNDFIQWGDTLCDTYDAFIAASSQTDNNVEADPVFTNPGAADYTLDPDSPCINAGVDLGDGFDDCLAPGSVWPAGVDAADQDDFGPSWEIGAYVYTSEGLVRVEAGVGAAIVAGYDAGIAAGLIIPSGRDAATVSALAATVQANVDTTVSASSGAAAIAASNPTVEADVDTGITATAGLVAVADYNATVNASTEIAATKALVLGTSYDATLATDNDITATAGAVAVAGKNALVAVGSFFATDLGVVSVSGLNTTVLAAQGINATAGEVSVAGYAASVGEELVIPAVPPGMVVVCGYGTTITAKTAIGAAVGNVVVAALGTSISGSTAVGATKASVAVTGYDAGVGADVTVTATLGAAAIAALNAVVTAETTVATAKGTVTITGCSPLVLLPLEIEVTKGEAAVAGSNATVILGTGITSDKGAVAVAAINPTVYAPLGIYPQTGEATVTGYDTVVFEGIINITCGTITVTAKVPTIALPFRFLINPTITSNSISYTTTSSGIDYDIEELA